MAFDELVQRLFGARRAESDAILTDATTGTIHGVALTDSEGGAVTVEITADVTAPEPLEVDGETYFADAGVGVEIPTSESVRAGDEVLVSTYGAGTMRSPVVTAAVGSGDRMRAAVTSARSVADAAQAVAEATAQHVWTDTQGLHVTYATKEQFQQEPTGPNQLSNANGILLRDGETYLSAFTPSGVAIYDGQGNDEVNRSAVFDSDGITFYVKKEVLGHDTAFEALDMSAALAKYGVDVSAVMGDLEVTSFRPTEDGWTGSTKAGTESFVTLVGGATHLLGSTAYGDTGMAGAGFERGLIHYTGGDGKLSMSSEAHAGIGLGEDFEPDSYFTDIPSEVESSCGVEVDVNARYTNLHGETIYNGSTPTIRAWSDYLRLEGNTKSHDFEMDDVIDVLLGTAQIGAAKFQGELDSQATLEAADYEAGWFWVVTNAGTYAGNACEQGDMVYAVADRGDAYAASDFVVAQANLGPNTNLSNIDIDQICV